MPISQSNRPQSDLKDLSDLELSSALRRAERVQRQAEVFAFLGGRRTRVRVANWVPGNELRELRAEQRTREIAAAVRREILPEE